MGLWIAWRKPLPPENVWENMVRPGTVTGWKLLPGEREMLLARFPPSYEKVIADHVTLRTGATPQTPLPRKPEARIVGRGDDGESLECLVVALDGTTERPDGSTYHITGRWGQAARLGKATTCFVIMAGSPCPHRWT